MSGLQYGATFREIVKEMMNNNPGGYSLASRLDDLIELRDLLRPAPPRHIRLRRAVGGWLVRLGERISP